MSNFKKDDYIVMLFDINCSEQFSVNFIYKQREEHYYLRPYLDSRGSTNNGVYTIEISKPKTWRYATPQEIEHYNKIGKPFDVTKQKYEPTYEIY